MQPGYMAQYNIEALSDAVWTLGTVYLKLSLEESGDYAQCGRETGLVRCRDLAQCSLETGPSTSVDSDRLALVRLGGGAQ
ncbi:hypothetical protein chiPu_0024109 [Chiloscyllium punctatum]|uniref:Uncharacterized protein n=1 Tax=Chiloscyllium punctatum TaxID=137246 RepID=A0A401TC41_CHIPU|nr:hypothetical protein [Chiloscyllium punctatum]